MFEVGDRVKVNATWEWGPFVRKAHGTGTVVEVLPTGTPWLPPVPRWRVTLDRPSGGHVGGYFTADQLATITEVQRGAGAAA